MKEQILIVHLGLGFEEANHLWSWDIYEYYSVELLEHAVKVCLPLTKKNNLPKKAQMEHPRLPEFLTLGTFTSDVDKYKLEQAKNDNRLRLKALGKR